MLVPSKLLRDRRIRAALLTALLVGTAFGGLAAAGADAPLAGIVALSTAPAPMRSLEYTGPLTNGASLVVAVAGDEDPWAATVQFKGGRDGVEDPRIGQTSVAGELRPEQESGAYPLHGLRLGDNVLEARTGRGGFYVAITYEEGRVPVVEAIHITSDGVSVVARDPNEKSGDRVVAYEFTVLDASGAIVLAPARQETPVLSPLPSAPGKYSVLIRAQDTRGAWSVTLAREFTVLGSLAQGGFGGGIQEGQTTIHAPAVDQRGNPIFEAVKPGGGALGLWKRSAFGLVRLAGCLMTCKDPFQESWIAKTPKLRQWLVEVIT